MTTIRAAWNRWAQAFSVAVGTPDGHAPTTSGSASHLSPARKLWQILPQSQRPAVFLMTGLILVGTMLETLSVGLIPLVLILMREPDFVSAYSGFVPLLARVGQPTVTQVVTVGALTLVAVSAVKAVFLGYLSWRQGGFVAKLQIDLSSRLFAGYMRQPYAFHLQRNSAQLIFVTNAQAGAVAKSIQQLWLLGTEGMVLGGVSILLLLVEPFGALLVVGGLALAGWGFNRFFRRYILQLGRATQFHEGLRLQHVTQGFGGVKEVKLLGREDDFLAQYAWHTANSARAFQRLSTLITLPRLWLELLAVTGLAVLVLILIEQGKPIEALLPTLVLFASAAFRLMPSVGRVLGALQDFRAATPLIDTVHGELSLMVPSQVQRPATRFDLQRTLAIDQISFQYPGTEGPTLRAVSLCISRGTSVGLIGGSGAGKSTLVDVILGLLDPSSGTVEIDGRDIRTDLRSWQDQIGYVPQTIFLTDDTLRRNVAFGLSSDRIDDAAVRRAIHAAQLDQFITELPEGIETIVGERGVRLSGGQRQRIGIARALYHDPAVLVLDEATSALDTATERGVMAAVRALRGEKTLIIVAHRTSTVEHCDRLYRLEQGSIVDEGDAQVVLARIPASARLAGESMSKQSKMAE